MSEFHETAKAVYGTVNGKKFVDQLCTMICGEGCDPVITDALKLAEAVGRQNVARAIRRACEGAGTTAVVRGKTVNIKC